MSKHKGFNIAISLAICLIVGISCAVMSGCASKVADYTNYVSSSYVSTNPVVFEDSLGEIAIKPSTEKDFKVLQLTDIHIGNGALSQKKDKKAIQAVCKLIEHSQPDLIILSGDMVFPFIAITGTNDNLSALKTLAKVIDKYNTPWTVCFGNHDAEDFALYSKSEICDYLESDQLKNCIFSRGDKSLDGMGNHLINIYNYDDSFNSTIFLFDNGSYAGETQLSGYQELSKNQVEWYKNKIESFNSNFRKTINSFVYYHIPGMEYKNAWSAYKKGEAELVFGTAGEKNERISCPSELGTFYETMKSLGSTKAIFCGHDHLNDFSVLYEGVRYTYSKSIDYTAYLFQGIAKKSEQRGGTELLLKGSNSSLEADFDIVSIKLTDIK